MSRIALWIALLAAAAGGLAATAPVSVELADFLGGDEGDPTIRRLVVAEMKEGAASRSFVATLAGNADASDRVAAALRALPFVERIDNGRTPPLTLDDPGVRRLFGWRYLLAPPPDFSPEGLRASLNERLGELASPAAPLLRPLIPADPTGAFFAYLSPLSGAAPPPGPEGVWSDGGTLYLSGMVAAPLADGELARLRQTAGTGATLSGPAVFAAESRQRIRSEAEWISLAASGAMLLLFLVAFRSPRLVLLLALPMLTGAVAGVAMVTLVHGSIQGITLAFGATIVGVAVDYPLHAILHAEGNPRRDALLLWPTLRLSALTTALGYGAMLFSDLPGLSQLGLFSITGVTVAALSVRYLLPPLLPAAPPSAVGERLGRMAGRPALRVVVALLLAGGIVAGSAHGVRWNDDIGRLNPVTPDERHAYEKARSHLAGAEVGRGIVTVAPTADGALALSRQVGERLAPRVTDGALARFRDVTSFLPDAATQRERQSRLPDRATLAASLAAAQEGLPFGPTVFTPFLDDVARSRSTAPVTADDLASTPLAPAVAPLLHRAGGGWVATTLLDRVTDEAAVARVADEVPGAYYLNLRATVTGLLADHRRQGARLALVGAALILLLLLGSLGATGGTGRVAATVALPVAATAGYLSLLGPLSLFHLIAFLLVAGLGVDYALFMARAGTERGSRSLASVWLSALSTGLVFGVLSLSSLPLLREIGATTLIGVALLFATGLALLPPLPGEDAPRH